MIHVLLNGIPGWLWRSAAGLAVLATAVPHASAAANEKARAQLLQAVRELNAQYDPQEAMIRRPFSSPGYHTTLKGGTVHPTRDSLKYAVALLDTEDPQWQKRAEDVLRKVISLQDQDPASRTYGIWSWFLEEPLDKMSPPDWNWADFCGVQLLQVALYHRARLPEDLAQMVDAAIRHAARSIQRRNVGPGYTNIAIMGTYVTLVAAELYGMPDLKDYAIARLRRFHAYTREQGGFSEYNSPTYTVVALQEIGRLRLQAKDAEAQRLANEIYRVAWEEIAHHFHPPTRQWAGPHSRCYSTLLPEKTLGLFQRATGGRVRFCDDDPPLTPEEYRLPLPCPEDLQPFFTRLDKPRELIKTFSPGNYPVIGTTFLDPDFALGTVNRGDLWNQRRSLLAYWGTAEKPAYLHLRFLHDGYDFAAAQFRSAQREGTVLAGVVLATDGGDTHVSLDKIKNGTVLARDLRLRFEFGGAAGMRKPSVPADFDAPVRLHFGTLTLDLQVLFAKFGDTPVRLEPGADPARRIAWIDLVFFEGADREFKLPDLDHAAAAFYLRLSKGNQGMPDTSCTVRDGIVRLAAVGAGLNLVVPVRPAKISELQKAANPS